MDQSNFSLNSLDTLPPNEINYDSAQFEDLRDPEPESVPPLTPIRPIPLRTFSNRRN
ncbi:MAG: hypothetical protein IJF17_03970 [Thermoguttaceae bacterium]|nr:hypothetical protein [Thermoguttaceae bacterium]MDO4425570.1 hypothetical protein [Planctomycetia bacterium]